MKLQRTTSNLYILTIIHFLNVITSSGIRFILIMAVDLAFPGKLGRSKKSFRFFLGKRKSWRKVVEFPSSCLLSIFDKGQKQNFLFVPELCTMCYLFHFVAKTKLTELDIIWLNFTKLDRTLHNLTVLYKIWKNLD